MKSFDFQKKKEESFFMTAYDTPLFKRSMLSLCFMILGMVIIGGLTRLTGSGLSIVEWKPVTGIFPPLTLEAWLREFSKYQQSPEFQKINLGITLSEFKSLFWLEYIHRLWGRLLGVILLIPTFLLIFKKQHRSLWPFLTLLWLLGAAQGVMGWIMVKSGLIQDPHVSPYRLAAHLLLGFAVFGVALWMTFSLYKNRIMLDRKGYSRNAFLSLTKLSLFLLVLVLLTAFWGALVAGLKAGLLYNTFPLMGGNWVPQEFLSQSPWWKDIMENPPSVQFIHRLLALMTTLTSIGVWLYQRDLLIPKKLFYAFGAVALCSLTQAFLGVFTLLLEVPPSLAVLHQGFAFIFFGSIVYTFFLLHQGIK